MTNISIDNNGRVAINGEPLVGLIRYNLETLPGLEYHRVKAVRMTLDFLPDAVETNMKVGVHRDDPASTTTRKEGNIMAQPKQPEEIPRQQIRLIAEMSKANVDPRELSELSMAMAELIKALTAWES